MAFRKSPGEKIFDCANFILLGIVGLVALYPFLYTLSMSLSTQAEAMREGLHLFPREVSLTSYAMVLHNPDILRGLGNTLFRTIVGTAASVIMCCLAAYPLSRKSLPYRRPITLIILFTMLFGGGMVPSFLLINSLGLYDSRWVYIIPGLISAFNVIIVKNFFQQIPEDYYESAMLDGASHLRILFTIFMPLSKPVLATITLWTAVGHWNSWFDAMLYVDSNSKLVLQAILQRIVIESDTALVSRGLVNPDVMQFTSQTIKAAVVVITILPIVLIYPFAQKYFVKGIMLGGVKE